MRFGIRGLLLIVAIILFLVALVVDAASFDLLVLGLAAMAGALLVEELGIDTHRRTSRDRGI